MGTMGQSGLIRQNLGLAGRMAGTIGAAWEGDVWCGPTAMNHQLSGAWGCNTQALSRASHYLSTTDMSYGHSWAANQFG